MISQFHFIQPLWLIAILPLILIWWFVTSSRSDSKAWGKVIDVNLLNLLLQGKDNHSGKLARYLLAITWFFTTIALADPSWEKIPQPVFQTNAARIIVLDLSNSMLVSDLKPSRLARARFKIEDILSREEEGQTGLVVFAGDAFTAAPLTRDTETIRSLLKILTPQLMPVQGSRVDLGLKKAYELLKQAGARNGQVLLIADGVSNKEATQEMATTISDDGHSISVLAVGTEEGGELALRNRRGGSESFLVTLDVNNLKNIATNGGGNYHLISSNNADLQSVLFKKIDSKSSGINLTRQDLNSDEWKSMGPILVLFLLPFAALAFKKGWLFNFTASCLVISTLTHPQSVMAYPLEKQLNNIWQNLSQNPEQQADSFLKYQQYEKARELSNDPLRKGSAEYKLKNYNNALENFKQVESSKGRYNEANTLAKLKKYKEAIATYNKALKLQPGMKDAIENKKTIEDYLKKRQQNSNQKDSTNNSDNKDNQTSENSKSDKNNKQQNANNSSSSKDSKNKQIHNSDKQDNNNQSQNISTTKDEEKKDGTSNKNNQFSDANKELQKDKNKNGATKKASGNEQTMEIKKQIEGEVNNQESTNQNTAKNDQRNSLAEEKIEAVKELRDEEKMAAEQWLRRIPDDPGGLLRRKFKSQYNQRRRGSSAYTGQPW